MALGSRADGFCQHVIEKLPIAKPLQNEPPKQLPVLAPLKQERDRGRCNVDRNEDRVVEKRDLEVRRIELHAVLHIVGGSGDELHDEQQIDER